MVKAIACPEERERIAAQVLAALPDWFGLPESTAAYVRDSRDLPFWTCPSGLMYRRRGRSGGSSLCVRPAPTQGRSM